MKQTESGKAFEYQLAVEISKFLGIPFLDTAEKVIGLNCYNIVPDAEKEKIQRAADEATTFLCCHDA
jgi:hypothetical protein